MIRSGVVSAAKAVSDVGKPTTSNTNCVRVTPSIQVQLDPLSGCGACSASGGCGIQLFPVSQTPLFVYCQRPSDVVLSAGDRVQIQLCEPDSSWLRIVLSAYGFPTIGMIFGVLAGYWSALALHLPQFTESFSLAGFVVGLGGGLIAWSRAEKSAQMLDAGENWPRIHKVIHER